MNPLPYGRQWITQADIKAVTDVLHSDWLTQGPAIERFERKENLVRAGQVRERLAALSPS